jgi:lysozyme
LHLYNCPANDATSYGNLVHHGLVCGAAPEAPAPIAGDITKGQGSAVLLQDLAYAEHAVEHPVTVPLTQVQYDALVSFTYNEGAGWLQTSTMLKVLNGRSYAAVPARLEEWVYGGGEKLPGLVTRRAAECKLFPGA